MFYLTECFGSNSNSEQISAFGKDDDESSRLLDWIIPSWSYEQSQMEHHMYFCTIFNLCSCNSSSSTQDENISSTWDDTSSSSIWEY